MRASADPEGAAPPLVMRSIRTEDCSNMKVRTPCHWFSRCTLFRSWCRGNAVLETLFFLSLGGGVNFRCGNPCQLRRRHVTGEQCIHLMVTSGVQQRGEAHDSGGQPPPPPPPSRHHPTLCYKEKLKGAKLWGARDAHNETDARSQMRRLKPGEGARLRPVGWVKASSSAVVIYSSHLVYGDVSEAPRSDTHTHPHHMKTSVTGVNVVNAVQQCRLTYRWITTDSYNTVTGIVGCAYHFRDTIPGNKQCTFSPQSRQKPDQPRWVRSHQEIQKCLTETGNGYQGSAKGHQGLWVFAPVMKGHLRELLLQKSKGSKGRQLVFSIMYTRARTHTVQ